MRAVEVSVKAAAVTIAEAPFFCTELVSSLTTMSAPRAALKMTLYVLFMKLSQNLSEIDKGNLLVSSGWGGINPNMLQTSNARSNP